MAPTLDWPTILSRFGTLVSQTYSLSSSLTSTSSAFLPAQLDELQRTLEDQAKQDNYFLHEDGDGDGGEAGAGGGGEEGETEAEGSVPRVRYTDPRNPLPHLVAVPVVPLEASADKTGRLGEALRTKLDPYVAQSHSEAVEHDELARAVPEAMQGGASGQQEEEAGDARLRQILQTLQDHDHFARRALRAWHHVRWRPDEDGQTYDFKMRLGDEDAGEVDADVEDEVGGEGQESGGLNGQLGGVGGDGTAGQEEVGGDEQAEEEQEEFEEEEEDDDEEMEDIDVS
ncbi:hypothetical protein BCV69DRAFT_280786 [Microstroma glucosiphilum]|uniref:Mediator complex subunit 8 n=1 Tax=Pseudomicrostroma glucosiphilum TaxID=1684307 RepID=A0A316UDA0_9BASI|nr:hypothetical protein BCV69DRAFT_280786 [Pseudomicrostroma glucosiphilum]PWN23176.1 hypothetical protein BCV69DRAFT_280786 [Pseudomicrostroma glucosiphilum]